MYEMSYSKNKCSEISKNISSQELEICKTYNVQSKFVYVMQEASKSCGS